MLVFIAVLLGIIAIELIVLIRLSGQDSRIEINGVEGPPPKTDTGQAQFIDFESHTEKINKVFNIKND